MQIVLDNSEGYQIESYDDRSVTIGGNRYEHSLLLTHDTIISPYPITLDDTQCQSWLEYKVELILLGTGSSLIMPSPALFAFCYQHKIGIEAMTTASACRTFNVVRSEGRKTLAILRV